MSVQVFMLHRKLQKIGDKGQATVLLIYAFPLGGPLGLSLPSSHNADNTNCG